MTHITRSEQETAALAGELAKSLSAGAVLLLSGELGAGKTAFVRGLAEGLGIDPAEVSSPTFTLLHEYRGGRLVLFHADLYRLDRASVEDVGLDDPRIAGGVLAVEWPERLERVISGAIAVELITVDPETRRIEVQFPTERRTIRSAQFRSP